MEQRPWRTDPRLALEVVGDLVADDEAEDCLGVRQLCDCLTGVLEVLALGKSDSHGLGKASADPASQPHRRPRIAWGREQIGARSLLDEPERYRLR